MYNGATTMNDLKIIVGLKCNLNCEYCCNRIKVIRDSFVPVKLDYIRNSNYETYQVTGGEPLMPENLGKTIITLSAIPNGKPVYLYTNGVYLTILNALAMRVFGVTGINIGVHGQPLNWEELEVINRMIPITLWINEDDNFPYVKGIFNIRRWRMNNCKTKAKCVLLKG